MTLANLAGNQVEPMYMEPCHCQLDKCRVRFVRFVDSTSVEVADNNGKILPDYRHPTQLIVKNYN